MIVLDTTMVSELMRPAPDPGVVVWLRGQPRRDLFTTAISVAEIGYGLARLRSGRRRANLTKAAARIFGALPERGFGFDFAAATAYPDIVTRREQAGRPISAFDAQIAATCRSRGAELATRNGRDFGDIDTAVTDPLTVT